MIFDGTGLNRINRMVRKTAVFVLAAFVLLLSGCAEIKITHPLGTDKLLEIDDVCCTMGTAKARLLEAKMEYENAEDSVLWSRTIGDITLSQYVKNTVEDEMKKYTAAQAMAKDLTVFISDDELRAAESSAAQLLDRFGQRFNMGLYDISYEDVVDMFLKRTYYNKAYEKLSENISMQISEADTKAIEINYVFIPASDGVEAAEKMRNEMLGGTDFETVCLKYDYEPEMNVTQIRGQMSTAFDNNAFALRDNEISEIVETRDGYYIINCLEDYMVSVSIANKNRMISEGKRERFRQAYEEFAKSSTLRFNSGEWDRIDISLME